MSRLDRLRSLMVEADVESLFVSHLVNVRYLSGFTGSNAAMLVAPDHVWFFTDGRYQDQARDEIAERLPDATMLITRDIAGDARSRGVTHAETHRLAVDGWRALGEPAPAGNLVERLRVVKDDDEIAALRTACQISTAALDGLLAGPIVGRSERELARDLEWRMLELGAEDKAFETILASGPHSAIPHHQPTDRVVQPGDLVKIDFGARHGGYHADCTRTVVAGRAGAWQREVHAVVQAAQHAGLDALVPQTELAHVHQAVTSVLADAGWLDHFTTGLGHGVGLEIHEDPFFGATTPGRLASRTVVTMEPGIYVPGRGGVRIEDTVLIGNHGNNNGGGNTVLTPTTRELLEIN